MKLRAKHFRLLTLLALPAASSGFAHAATLITFESPYTLGAVSSGPGSITTERPFDGQQGWSRSTSSGVGNIIATTTSGSYTGGQGLTGNLTGSGTYIGAKAVGPMTSFTFDFRYYTEEMAIGGWNDDDADGLFDQAEAEFMAGTVKIGAVPVTSFGLRTSGFGTRYSTGTSGTVGDWYRMTVTPDFANLQVTLGVHNLTTNSSVSLATSVFTLTAAEFGVDPTTFEGIIARVTSSSTNPATLDNINVIPEPAAAMLGCLGLLGLLRRRRA